MQSNRDKDNSIFFWFKMMQNDMTISTNEKKH